VARLDVASWRAAPGSLPDQEVTWPVDPVENLRRRVEENGGPISAKGLDRDEPRSPARDLSRTF
jgi:hypothetical protein